MTFGAYVEAYGKTCNLIGTLNEMMSKASTATAAFAYVDDIKHHEERRKWLFDTIMELFEAKGK